jgi:hypothetical protein
MVGNKVYLVDGLVITAAFRYALGRKTAMVKHIVDMILDNWHLHTEADKKAMVKEIFEYKKHHGKIGHSIDEEEWMRIVERQLEDYKNLKKDG